MDPSSEEHSAERTKQTHMTCTILKVAYKEASLQEVGVLGVLQHPLVARG